MPIPCSEAAQALFDEGLLHQHSFGHDAATERFRAALQAEPACAMARWGMALARLDNLFATPDEGAQAEARALLTDAAIPPAARNAWIAALADLVAPGRPWPERLPRFAAAMRDNALANPRDEEAQVFHALALLMAAPADDALAAAQQEAAAILEPIWMRQPEHPGVMHYLIHAYDVPALAPRGLPAARRYAAVAADSPHALHMPSHIFTRLGEWQDSVGANRRSADLARRSGLVNDELHARDYLVYALLQLGRMRDAQAVWQEAQPLLPRMNRAHLGGPYAAAAMPARLALEAGDWAAAAALPLVGSDRPEVAALPRFARAIGLIRSGRTGEAAPEIAALRQHEAALRAGSEPEWAARLAAQAAGASGLARIAQGEVEAGLAELRAAAEAEEAVPKDVVIPGPVAPLRELLGEALLSLGRPAEAEAAFVRVLASEPKRFRSLAGAAAAAGRPPLAIARYRLLLAIAGDADADRPEIVAARGVLATAR